MAFASPDGLCCPSARRGSDRGTPLMDAVSIQLHQLDRVWPILKRASDRIGNFGREHVEEEIRSGRAMLWPGPASALVSSLRTTPDGQLCLYLWLAAGQLEEVLSLLSDAEEWAREQGCTRSSADGRSGWTKPLAPRGYRPVSVNFVKDL